MASILDGRSVGELVGNSRPLISVNYNDAISDSLKKLEGGHVFGGIVYSGPVMVGLLDIKDVMSNLMKFTRMQNKDFSTESAQNIIDQGKMFSQQVVGAIVPRNAHLERVTRNSTVWEAATKMVNSNERRLVVVDEHGRPVNVITQFDVVKFLCENTSEFGEVCTRSVGSLQIGSSPVITATLDSCTAEALRLMMANNVRSVAIINSNEDRELIANLSLSDFKGLDEESFKSLSKSIFEFLLESQETPKPVVCCSEDDTLQDVIAMMVANKVHRVYCVSKNLHPMSVISLIDILKFAVNTM